MLSHQGEDGRGTDRSEGHIRGRPNRSTLLDSDRTIARLRGEGRCGSACWQSLRSFKCARDRDRSPYDARNLAGNRKSRKLEIAMKTAAYEDVVAEREGFEPPMGLHPCRISSAVHSTTLPPLLVPSRAVAIV